MKITARLVLIGILINAYLMYAKAETASHLQTPWGQPLTIKTFEKSLK